MSDPRPAADRNLLFGILALQMDFIGRDALIAAMHAWVLDKGKLLGQILRDRGDLSADRLALLEALVAEHLRQHGDDPQKSLAAVSSIRSARRDLERIADADVQASLAAVACAPPSDPESTGDLAPPAGPRFRVLRPHAKGGLGAVYVAEDMELHRQVALKEIRPERADDPASRGRFLLEAEITGGLEHPGVVPVYGLGSYADGRPFYAMRFVKGDNLKEAIKRFRAAEQPGRDAGERRLAFRQLLRRFVDVCNAVAYAHSRGVLHRDLKPGNIMLGQYGETLVVDWGLAKVVGRDGAGGAVTDESTLRPSSGSGEVLTQMGSAVGTPAYMSPEQAAGRLDLLGPASDVYSLGATLYAVLTGQAPFKESDAGALLGQVQRGQWRPPREVRPGVPRALDAVCRKAMALKPEDRYPSALALAAEVEHWLADEPVSAYREPLVRRLARWGRRHRPWVAGAAALLLTAVAALAVGLVVVEAERQRTARERDDKEKARTDEAQARATAMEALRSLTDDVVEQQLSRGVKLGEADKAFLRKVLEHYQTFAALRGDGPESRAIRAEGFHRVGYLRHRLGELPDAEAAFDEAIALRKPLVADFPDVPQYRRDLALSYDQLGNLLRDTGRPRQAETVYGEALALGKRLVAEFPDVPQYRLELALSHNHLGILLMFTGRPEKAEAAYRETLALRKQLADEFPKVPGYRSSLADIQMNLGILLKNTGRPREAEAALRDCLALRKPLADDSPHEPDYRQGQAKALGALGLLLGFTGRPKEAEAAFGEAVALQKRLAADFPTVPDYRDDLGKNLINLGNLLKATGRLREAEAAYGEALTLFKQLAGDFPTVDRYLMDLAKGHGNLGNLLTATGRPREAEAGYAEALALWKRLAADFPSMHEYRRELARTHHNLGLVLSKTGRPREAEGAEIQALAVRKQLADRFPDVPEHRQELAGSHLELGNLLAAAGRPLEAETAYGEALALFKRLATELPAVPDFQNDVAGTLGNLANLAVARPDWPRARALLEEALPYHKRALNANPKQPAYRQCFRANRSTLASTLVRLGEHAAAAAAAEELARLGYQPAGDSYDAACYVSRCVPLAEKDAKLPEPRRKELADAYAARAVQLLRQAAAHGYKDVAHMKDTDLDPLRQRPDFEQLLAEFEKETPK